MKKIVLILMALSASGCMSQKVEELKTEKVAEKEIVIADKTVQVAIEKETSVCPKDFDLNQFKIDGKSGFGWIFDEREIKPSETNNERIQKAFESLKWNYEYVKEHNEQLLRKLDMKEGDIEIERNLRFSIVACTNTHKESKQAWVDCITNEVLAEKESYQYYINKNNKRESNDDSRFYDLD